MKDLIHVESNQCVPYRSKTQRYRNIVLGSLFAGGLSVVDWYLTGMSAFLLIPISLSVLLGHVTSQFRNGKPF